MQRFFFVLILAFTLLSFDTYAYDKYTTSRITTLEGLSQNDVADILQDSYGYMWIATNDGLCRYDGTEFKIFSIGDAGLESNLILSLLEDQRGNIWVGTANKGLFCYLRDKHRFYHYLELTDVPSIVPLRAVRNLTMAADGSIWGYEGTSQSMIHIQMNQQTQRVSLVDLYPRNENGIEYVSTIQATQSRLYIGSSNGLFVYNPQLNDFTKLNSNREINDIIDMCPRGELVHISTRTEFITLNTRTGRVKKHNLGVTPWRFFWQGNTLWLTTNSGVYTCRYLPAKDEFRDLEVVESFIDNTARVFTKDHNGGIWIGFLKAGIRRYELNKKPFMISRGFGNDHILPIFPTQNGDIWVGTEGSGLFRIDSINSNSINENILSKNSIYSIDYAAANNSLYVATDHNLIKITMGDDNEPLDQEISLHNSAVRKILVDGDYLWLALYNRGVVRQNLADESYTSLNQKNNLPSNIVRNLMQDRNGNIWICTSDGIAKIPSDQRFVANPKVKSVLSKQEGNHYALSIIEDNKGDIWYGTLGYGLYKLDKRADDTSYNITHFSTKDGLASNVIKSILEDDNGVIWVSTNRGLSTLTTNNNEVKITNIDIHDGLQDYEFNELSAVKLPDGSLAFGGVSGYNYFNPNNFTQDTTDVRSVITDFRLLDRSILDDENFTAIAPGGLHGEQGILLQHDQNNFTIKFAGISFSNSSKCQYKYWLQGADHGWVDSSDGVCEVSYTNLSPGRYTFLLSAANADGVWSSKTLKLNISIEHPWWTTWYAILTYITLFTLIGTLVIRHIRNLIRRRNEVKLANMERIKMEEMLDMRTRFFTNISHEFRTPLTLILSPLQYLISDEQIAANPKWTAQLNTMAHNGNSLMRLINEFLSYTKHESGGLKVQLSQGEFTSMIQRLFEQFKFWAEQRGLTLRYNAPNSNILVNFDQYLIEQVIYNLASNAIKYTPVGGEITLAVEEHDYHIIFSIKDSGCGISEKMRPHVFERFYSQTTDASKEVGGTGIGLFLTKSLVELHDGDIWFTTEVNVGTTFFVKLPKGGSTEKSDIEENIIEKVDLISRKNDTLTNTTQRHENGDETPPTILIVDDNIEILQVLSELFVDHYTVITANDGEDGWEKASTNLPEIIISDVMMPKKNGLDLCDMIKNDATTSHIPVILLSAKASNEDITAGLRCSADAYCPKPFDNKILIETVGSILTNRRKLADKFATNHSVNGDVKPFTEFGDDATTNTDKVFLKRLTEYIESNIHNPDLVVNDLCNYMGITPLVLNKKLKSLINMTANALIRTIRLRRAATLLKTARYTIADVTYDVGFSDLRYFRECFKKEFGLLPQEYKDQAANGVIIEPKQSLTVNDKTDDTTNTKLAKSNVEKRERNN